MKIISLQISACLLMFLCSTAVFAQNSENSAVHPLMTSKFNLGVGVYVPSKKFKVQVNGSTPGDKVDFDETLNVDESESTLTVNFRWRYTKNWSLWAQYWAIDSQGSTTLTEDIEFNGETFLAGSFAAAGVKTTIARIFFGRSFLKSNPRHEWGLGAGIHLMKFDAFIEGQIDTGGGGSTFAHEQADVTLPLPNLGAWYMYSWSPKWMFSARVDWLSISVGDYSGGLTDTQVGIDYQISDIFGVALSYNRFGVDIDARSSDLSGQIETGQAGPRLTLTAAF